MVFSPFSAHLGREKENITSGTRPAPITIPTHRRILSRRNSPSSSSSLSTPSTSPTRTSTLSLHNLFHHVQTPQPTLKEPPKLPESDEECWEIMLDLQMEYHCYKSARLEAAVEARMSGCSMEEIPRPSRLCLDLLNEEFIAKLEADHRDWAVVFDRARALGERTFLNWRSRRK